MKKQLKKALISVFAFSLTFASVLVPNTPVSSFLNTETTASADSTGEVRYAGNTFAYEIIGNGTSADIVRLTKIVRLTEATCPLPSSVTVNGKSYPVTEIGDRFAENAKIRTLSIPDSVKKVGICFGMGSYIESVGIGKNVQEIGASFCSNCSSLRSVVYSGNSLNVLGDDPFKNTPFINKTNNKGAVTMGDWLIKYTGTASSIRVLDLAGNQPDIHKVANEAFRSNKYLTSVNLNGISVINYAAFRFCPKLKTVTDGYSLSSVGGYVFDDTPWFDTQEEKNGGTVILDRVLLQYSKVSNNTIDLTNYNIQYIAQDALEDVANKATTLKLPNSILTVDRYAFTVSNTRSKILNLYLYGSKITANNYQNYRTFLEKNFEAFRNTDFAQQISRDRGKQILNSLGIAYVGNGAKGNYSVEKEYQIANKLYHYVGSTYKYKFDYNGGSKNFMEEMLFPKGFVCRDYADMYMFLMELAGVNAERIDGGNSEKVNHAFNVVEIGVDWFFVDTCWYGADNLYMVNRTTLEKESSSHIVHSLEKKTYMPSDMFTLSGVPYCKYTLGDVNRDGVFNTADKTLFQKYLNGSANLSGMNLIVSDMNKDGKFNSADLTEMNKRLK